MLIYKKLDRIKSSNEPESYALSRLIRNATLASFDSVKGALGTMRTKVSSAYQMMYWFRGRPRSVKIAGGAIMLGLVAVLIGFIIKHNEDKSHI